MDGAPPFASAWSARLPGTEPADALILALLVTIAGRVWLACLPPGLPGRHAPRELAVTWAASLLLGIVWLALASAAAGTSSTAFLVVAAGVPAVVAAVLAALGPAALVPRHEPEPLPAGPAARALVAIAVLAAPALAAWRHGASAGVTAFATVSLAATALAWARAPAVVGAAGSTAVAIATGLLPVQRAEGQAALGAAGAAAGIVLWIRRGDRRGLALVAAGVAHLAIAEPGGWSSAIAVAIAVPIGSLRGTRGRALAWAAGGLALGIALRKLDGGRERWCCGRDDLAMRAELALIVGSVATTIAAGALARRGGSPPRNPSSAPRGREALVLGAAASGVLLLAALGNAHPSNAIQRDFPHVSAAWSSFWTLASVCAGIALSRALEPRAPDA